MTIRRCLSRIAVCAILATYAGHAMETSAPTLTSLHSFCAYGCVNGFAPWGGVVEGPDGAYYGMTFGGGNQTPYMGEDYGVGVVYRVTRAGRFRVLHRFDGPTEGAYPEGSLTVGADGNLYGTTSEGGPANGGSVFKISINGAFTVLHQFSGSEGWAPWSAPVEDAQGNWYGTTLHGGTQSGGTVYKIAEDGNFSTLYNFDAAIDAANGADPQGGLMLASDGNLYGTTMAGGGSGYDAGTVFSVTPQGALTTLHIFSYGDGSIPEQALATGQDGALYGTTSIGGAQGVGTVFRITLAGEFTSIFAFSGSDVRSSPTSALTPAPNGGFFGQQAQGGANMTGAIYHVTITGSYADLYDFPALGAAGAYPEGSLIIGSDGALYGTTLDGGQNDGGTIFRLGRAPIE
jgi:uncharacterized repeat protein (TIGR03803 family)